MPMMEDSGISTAFFAGEIEDRREVQRKERLIQGKVPTHELKKRYPAAFTPNVILLIMAMIEARSGVTFNSEVKRLLKRMAPDYNTMWEHIQINYLAFERSAEMLERKVNKELDSIGYPYNFDNDGQLSKLADEAYETGSMNKLRNYILARSKLFIQIRADMEKKGDR